MLFLFFAKKKLALNEAIVELLTKYKNFLELFPVHVNLI